MGAEPNAAAELWIACHGYGQLARYFLEPFAVLADARRLIAAPEGLSRFYLDGGTGRVGASWMTKDDREAEMADYLRYLDAVRDALVPKDRTPPALTALGFSQGAATAARWTARGRGGAPVGRLILWGGLLPPEAGADRLRGCAVTFVIGERDRYLPVERVREEAAALAGHGVGVEVVTYPGEHAIDPDVLRGLVEAPR